MVQSGAKRVLLPMDRCDNLVAGVQGQTVARLVDAAVQELEKLQANACSGACGEGAQAAACVEAQQSL